MGRFLVTVRGENFLLSLDGEHGKFGFTASWVVVAQSSAEAERIAIIQLYQQLNQNEQTVNNSQDAAKVSVVATEKRGLLACIGKKRSPDILFSSEDDAFSSGKSGETD